MFDNLGTHRRQRSLGNEPQYHFGNTSFTPNRSTSFLNRPQIATNQSFHHRDSSADDVLLRKSLNSSFTNSPYIEGKRNPNYQNPNMRSSQVFYEHNYGYKNDLPNDRLLVPVKNDRYRKDYEGSRTPNRGDRTPTRDRTPNYRDITPNREERVPLTPTRSQRQNAGEERFTRSSPYSPQYHYEEEYAPSYQPVRNMDFERTQKQVETPIRHSRKNSAISETPQRNIDFDYKVKEEREPILRSRNERGAAGRPSGANLRRSNVEDSMRDDRSEASTVISTLSSAGYVCPKCLNRHMADQKHSRCTADRFVARESERRLATVNRQYLDEAEEKKKEARARRVEDSRLLQQQLQRAYLEKRDKRRWPEQERVTTFDGIFNRQEEHNQLQKALGESFRVNLRDQIKYTEQEKEKEKRSNLKPYNTSLLVGEGYNNKFLESQQTVKATLKDQVEEKMYNRLREEEVY